MALTKPTSAAKFENPEDDAVETVESVEIPSKMSAKARMEAATAAFAAEQAAAEAEEAAAANTSAPGKESKQTAVAAAAPRAMAVHKKIEDPLKDLENAFPVSFNSLKQLVVTNGNVMVKDSKKALGAEVGIELISFQASFVVSPGIEGEEGAKMCRYSDDGVTATTGENMQEYLQALIAGDYPKAKFSERVVIVGCLFDAGKSREGEELKDSLVQVSLPPTSKASFQQYRLDNAFKISRGKLPPGGGEFLKLSCELKSDKNMTWTVVGFSRYNMPA